MTTFNLASLRKHSFLLFFITLISSQVNAQKGLLWEVSKEGSSKKTYLYGTMHVSGKIAYHLGEEFFKAVNQADAIALESNPIIWLDDIFASEGADEYLGKFQVLNQIYQGFYEESFKFENLDNKDWGNQLSSNHYLTNWMLYRENSAMKDFEEETFLDLFIYQIGRKNNKPVYSLEDFNQSTLFSNLARIPDVDTKERASWFTEMTKEKSVYDLIRDAYRNQDLDLLDSLNRESSSENNLKYLLYERNYIMAHRIDSFMKMNVGLFVGIGAAHLPHTEGVINLLRKKGYTLKPILPTINDKSKAEKERLSLMKSQIPLATTFESELFSLRVPNKIYEAPSASFQREFFAPELTNGTFYSVNELSTYHYFKGDIQDNYLLKMDSLLFENIPGKIISKTDIVKNGYKGLDIVNKTKSGDFQRYQILITPLKVFIFKMGGKDEYVKNNSASFFNSISLKMPQENWVTKQPIKSDFKVDVPAYHDIKFNTQISSLYGHTELEAYDDKTKEYYYVKRASLHDFGYIEEDAFELNRILNKFVEQFKPDSALTVETVKTSKYPSARASVQLKNKSFLQVQVYIKGAYYYVLAAVSKKQGFDNRFFTSFQLQEFTYTFPYSVKIDSTLQFQVHSNYLKPTYMNQLYEKASEQRRNKKEKEDKSYLTKSFNEIYYSENFEQVRVDFVKFHTYTYYANTDSLWNRQIRFFMDRKSLFVHARKQYSKGDTNILELTLMDTNSCRTIFKKYIQVDDKMYTLTANLDTISPKSKFISEFFSSFTPIQIAPKQPSLFVDKAQVFFDVLAKGDSISKDIAYKSILTHLRFEDKHASQLMQVIKHHPFPKEHINAKAQLIKDLGAIKDSRIVPFVSSIYKEMEDTALYQVSVLRALASQKSKEACLAFIQLLEHDIPIGASKDDLRNVFNSYNDSLELTKYLYPKLLNYTFINDYKLPIYQLLSKALDSMALPPKYIKGSYSQILREAKMVLKSQIGYEQAEGAKTNNNNYYYTSYLNKGNTELVMYSKMLMPFYKDKNVKAYFAKFALVKDYTIRTEVAVEFVKNKIKVDELEWKSLIADPINYALVYRRLEQVQALNLFPKELISQEMMAKSLLYKDNFNFKTDSVLLVKKQPVTLNGVEGYYYFFKSKKEKDDKWSLDYIGLQPQQENQLNVVVDSKKTGIGINRGKNMEELITDHVKSIEILNRRRAFEKTSSYSYNYFD
ncbi:MAG: TraB/GumN family protein [Bacteroidia bacterium]|nr:TraB/GumN family protein [Bacteroidia bacterium]